MNKFLTLRLAAWVGVCLVPIAALADGLLGVNNPAKNGFTTGLYASADAFQGNDSVAMRQYGNEWQGNYSPRAGTNIGLLAARAEVGAQWNGFRLGVLRRADALVQAGRDTNDLARQYNSSSGYDVGRTYSIDYQLQGFEADGARLSKSFAVNHFEGWKIQLGAGASVLSGKQVKLETASGQVVTLNAKDFNANVAQTSLDSATDTSGNGKFSNFFGIQPAAVSGQGFAVDLGVLLLREDGLRLEAAVNDLAASMAWKNLPNYVANYNTATKYYDNSGFVHFNPTATSQSSFRDITQTIEPKVWLSVTYPLGGVELQAATGYTAGYWFPELGVGYQLNPAWRVSADYDLRFATLGLAIHHQWAYLALRSDHADLNQAKAYGLSVGVNIPF